MNAGTNAECLELYLLLHHYICIPLYVFTYTFQQIIRIIPYSHIFIYKMRSLTNTHIHTLDMTHVAISSYQLTIIIIKNFNSRRKVLPPTLFVASVIIIKAICTPITNTNAPFPAHPSIHPANQPVIHSSNLSEQPHLHIRMKSHIQRAGRQAFIKITLRYTPSG